MTSIIVKVNASDPWMPETSDPSITTENLTAVGINPESLDMVRMLASFRVVSFNELVARLAGCNSGLFSEECQKHYNAGYLTTFTYTIDDVVPTLIPNPNRRQSHRRPKANPDA